MQFCVYVCVCVSVYVLCAFTLCVCVANICKKTTHAAKLHNGSTAPRLHGCMASQRWCVSLLRHAPPCSLTKSINTMQAQHDEHEADEGTRTPAQSQRKSQSQSRGRVRVEAESQCWSHCCCLRGSCYVPTLSYIKGGGNGWGGR